MDLKTLLLFLAGFVLLVVGAEVLVRGAARLAVAIGITPLIVGQTVVAYGTSAPELAVSIRSATEGQPDIAIGNVVGSNISNILLVLGITALIRPVSVSAQVVRFSVPVMIAVSGGLLLIAADGRISRVEGAGMLLGAILYSAFCILQSRRQQAAEPGEEDEASKLSVRQGLTQLALIAVGITGLVFGAMWLVNGAVKVAELVGVSELVIGLTVIAVGTSLPEIATSIMAGARGAPDIALGNAVGSNIFNVLLVLGGCAVVAEINVSPSALRFDIPVMIVVAVACLPVFFTGMKIARWEGVLFLCYYAAYVLYVVLLATHHDSLEPYSKILFGYLAPLTAATLLVLTVRAWRTDRS